MARKCGGSFFARGLAPRIFPIFLCSAIAPLIAQQPKISPSMTYHRVLAVTPLIGSGTAADPKRPMFVPAAQPARAAGDRSGVLGYQMQISDDGKFALVELVFQNPQAFQDVLAAEAPAHGIAATPALKNAPPGQSSGLQAALEAAVPGLKMFERGKSTQAQILAEFQKHKKNFQFSPIGVPVL